MVTCNLFLLYALVLSGCFYIVVPDNYSFVHFICSFVYKTGFSGNVCSLFSSKTCVFFYLNSTRESGLGTNQSRLSKCSVNLQCLKFCACQYPGILLYRLEKWTEMEEMKEMNREKTKQMNKET